MFLKLMFWALVYIINSVDKTKCRVHLIISKRIVSRIKKNDMEMLRLLILRAHHPFDLRRKKSIFFILISLLVKTILGTYKYILCPFFFFYFSCKITKISQSFVSPLFQLLLSTSPLWWRTKISVCSWMVSMYLKRQLLHLWNECFAKGNE